MKKVLFATTNPAKIKKYKKELEKRDVEVLTINDLNKNVKVEENGKDAIENALLKAKAFYEVTGIATIGMDNSLFIAGIPEEKQPGTHVRRVGGRELTDEEMIEYYTNLTREYGGKLTAKWIFGLVVYNEKGAKKYSWSKDHFYFVDTPCEKRNPGYPLDSISILPENDKYFLELTDEEKEKMKQDTKDNEVVEFIVKYL